jgi:hypothetical protein
MDEPVSLPFIGKPARDNSQKEKNRIGGKKTANDFTKHHRRIILGNRNFSE